MWMLHILGKNPSIEQVKKAGVVGLSKIKGISEKKAEAILKKNNDRDSLTRKTIQNLISITAKEILHKEQLIDSSKDYLNGVYKTHPSVKLLNDIKGIRNIMFVCILLSLDD